MRIVAIETSGQCGSVATLTGETEATRLVGQTVLPADQRSAQSLAPALRDLLAQAEWKPDSIGLVVVAVGPGSFTGLRIGVTTAKTLAYATGAEIIGVNTLAVLADQAPPSPSALWTVIDAQRGELFVAKFELAENRRSFMVRDTTILGQDAWLAELRPGDRLTGPALRRVSPRLPEGVATVPEELWQPTAASVGRVGWLAYAAGQRDDVWKLVPNYYRLSAAEEKADSKEQGARSKE
jgi:tRNA threonylcarbamoyladenosine biosynthesis protein TsaB